MENHIFFFIAFCVLFWHQIFVAYAAECKTHSDCKGWFRQWSCCVDSTMKRTCVRGADCLNQEYCLTDHDCGNPAFCCRLSKCLKDGCLRCTVDSDCYPSHACCKQFLNETACFHDCLGKHCSSNNVCAGDGECCRSGKCVNEGCNNKCTSNSECDADEYCCKGGNTWPWPLGGDACAKSCVGEPCNIHDDCGPPDECCVSGKCAKDGCPNSAGNSHQQCDTKKDFNQHTKCDSDSKVISRNGKCVDDSCHSDQHAPDSHPLEFDFDHLINAIGKHGIFAAGNLEKGNVMPHLDLTKFFELFSHLDFTTDQAVSESESDAVHQFNAWKKENVEKLLSGDPSEYLKLRSLMNMDVFHKAFSLAEKSEGNETDGAGKLWALKFGTLDKTENECPVGTVYTYLISGKLKKCFHLDIVKIVAKLLLFKLTSPSKDPPEFPTKTNNLVEALATPVLNQPSALVVLNSLIEGFKTYDIKTPFTLTWPFLWLGNALRNKQLASQYLAPGHVPNLTTYEGYATFLDQYREKQREKLFGIFPMKKFIHYPLVEDPGFEGITKSNRWQSDEVFTLQRLAGLNPMSLKKLSEDDLIVNDNFNPNFNWDEVTRKVSGKSFKETVKDGKAFVLDYPLLQGITNMEDIEINVPHHRPLRKTVSPITLFVSVPGVNKLTKQNENTLKPVAIQMDMDKGATVFTPSDGSKWLMAKEEVQRADIVYVEVIEHLLKTHLLMEPICVIMHRSFSKLHPLYQLFHPHCKYLSVTNSVGVPALFDQNEFLHIIFSIGNTGSINLLNKGYKEMSWEDTNFEENLKKRGVHDNETLPYFPYRDDGLLLWEKVGKFAKEYVDLYYPSAPELNISLKFGPFEKTLLSAPASIITDIELQSFALQLSSEKIGKIPCGRFKDFPKVITSYEQLVDVVKRILFIPIQHSAINYPVSYYGAFTPNMPTKLYDPDAKDFSINNLPYYNIVSYQLSIAMTLGSIRYDKLFDYSDILKDDRAKNLVKKYYDELHGDINKSILERNQKRQLEGKFIYPYLMPQWLTNSIQT